MKPSRVSSLPPRFSASMNTCPYVYPASVNPPICSFGAYLAMNAW